MFSKSPLMDATLFAVKATTIASTMAAGMFKEGYNQVVRTKTPLSPTAEENEALLQQINTPRIFNLTIPRDAEDINQPLKIYVYGCAGDGREKQKEVAKMIKENPQPDFFIITGDTFYEDGVDSVNDISFKEKFDDVYYNVANQPPSFLVMGNHCHALYSHKGLNYPEGKIDPQKIAAQVDHTFSDPKIKKVYESDNISLADLGNWNMPSHTYLLRWENTEIFFIDSNTYIREYLALCNGTHKDYNQALFLNNHVKNPGKTKILVMHHPLRSKGKRQDKRDITNLLWRKDINVYLSDAEINELKEKHNIEGNYSEMLYQIMVEKQGFNFELVCAAHDHMLSLDKDEKLCQVITGGGGGKLQHRKLANGWKSIPFCASDFGFVELKIYPNKKNILIDFHYSLEHRRHFSFDTSKQEIIQEYLSNESFFESEINYYRGQYLRQAILKAYEMYMNSLEYAETTEYPPTAVYSLVFHGSDGIKRADDLRNLVNNYEKITFNEMAKLVKEIFVEHLLGASLDSLITFFRQALQDYKITYEEFIETPQNIYIPPTATELHSFQRSRSFSTLEDESLTPAIPKSRSFQGGWFTNSPLKIYSGTSSPTTIFSPVMPSPPLLSLNAADAILDANRPPQNGARTVSFR